MIYKARLLVLIWLCACLCTTATRANNPVTIDVTEMGAKGDGSSDDSKAFETALARANPATGGCGTVYVPPSTNPYLISKPINLLSGETLLATNGTVVIAPFLPTAVKSGPLLLSIKNASKVSIQGLIFDGATEKIGISNTVIQVFQSSKVVFEQVEVRNSRGIGILFSGGDKGVTYSGLQNCRFENIGKYYLTSENKKEDRKQTVSFCCAPRAASGEFLNQHNFVSNCHFGHDGFDNLSLGQQSYFVASDNHFTGTHNGGNIYCADSRHIRITNNKAKAAAGNGIDCFANQDLTITGNESSFNGGAGIMAGDTHCCIIADNKTIGNYQSVQPSWQDDHPDARKSNHRGGITIGGEKGDGTGTTQHSSATDPGGSADIIIKNNLSGDNQPKDQRTQAYGIQVRTTASVKNLLVTPDNKIFGNTEGPFGEQLKGFTAPQDAKLTCPMWNGN